MQVQRSVATTNTTRTHLAVGVATATLLVIATWGHITPFWGDYGKWLYEVQEVGAGKALYTEIYWPQLPLAAWLFGGWTRVAGSELSSIWALTATLALTVALLFATYASQLVHDRRVAAWVIPPALVISFAITGLNSAPIAVGMYMPAAPLGAVLLLLALVLSSKLLEEPSWGTAFGLGIIVALALATKIDFWPPLGVLVVGTLAVQPHQRTKVLSAMLAGGLLVAVPIVAVLLRTIPAREAVDLLLGFGQAREFAGRASPTLERLVLELTSAFATLGVVWAAMGSPGDRRSQLARGLPFLLIAGACGVLWIAQGPPGHTESGAFGWPGRREAISALVTELAQHAPSAFLPFVALFLASRLRGEAVSADRRRFLLLVSAVACAARLRRMGEHVDFQNALIEIPLYASLAVHYSRGLRAPLLAVLVCAAGFSHWYLSYGALTRRGWRPAVQTARGTVHMTPRDADLLRSLEQVVDSIDPTRSRPLFAFGYSGGLNYFLRRANPTSTTQGLAFSVHTTVDSNVALIHNARQPAILIDNRDIDALRFPQKGVHLLRWRAPTVASPYTRVDRPIFDALARECGEAIPVRGHPTFSVRNCGK